MAYLPSQGDLVILSFDPQTGHEQKGRRPALIVSVNSFNRYTKLAFCCPITNTDRDSHFHVPLPPDAPLTGFVMCEQMKSLDVKDRRIKFVTKATPEVLDEVLAILDACLFPASDL
jgi:mRNA interferase MazF